MKQVFAFFAFIFLSYSCDNEKCWLKQNAIEDGLTKEEINNLYAPTHPVSWKKNKNDRI